jgi:hypothetical protein
MYFLKVYKHVPVRVFEQQLEKIKTAMAVLVMDRQPIKTVRTTHFTGNVAALLPTIIVVDLS